MTIRARLFNKERKNKIIKGCLEMSFQRRLESMGRGKREWILAFTRMTNV
jgi:hypothetical protein